jgi:branched-chain amino acid transport system substrate-binding protein
MLVALTGLASGIGIPQVVAAEMSADRIAAEGGLLVGGKRYNFEILSIDAPAEEPERARTGASRFVFRDNVKFISPSGDPADSAASTVTEDEKVIVFGGSGNAPLYGEKDYMMNCHSTAMFFADAYYAKLIEENPDWNRWVYLQINGNWDQVAVPYSERAIKNLGKEWLGIQVVDQGTVDFTPSVSGVLSKDPDVIIVGQFVGSAPPLMKTIREMGWDGPMVSGVNTYLSLPEIMKGLEGVEEYAEGFTQVDYAHFPPTAEGQAFIDEYKSRRGGEFNPYAFGAWWALETLFAALQAAGTVDDPDAIMAAYEKVQVRYPFYEGEWVNGSGGKETFGKDRICETPQAFSVIRNGEPVSLDIIIPHIP